MTEPNSITDFTEADFDDHTNVLEYFTSFGYNHALGIDIDEAQRVDASSIDFEKMAGRFQSFFWEERGIQPDGILGPVTRAEMRKKRCGCPDIPNPHKASGDSWDDPCSTSLKVWCDKSGLEGDLTTQEFEDLWYKQFEEHRRVCNFNFEIVPNRDDAHYIGLFERMGGGTLAWSEFPSSCSGQSVTKSNTKVNWSRILFIDTSLHEQGHGLGLPHGPAGSVMYWTVDREYDGTWQRWDIRQLVNRYGEPVFIPGPDPDPDPPGDSEQPVIDGTLSIDIDGEVFRYIVIPEVRA